MVFGLDSDSSLTALTVEWQSIVVERCYAGLNIKNEEALAKERDEPLLFKGNDFRHADIESAEF